MQLKIIDTHIHGGYGINFNTCSIDEFRFFSKKMFERGILAYCPTLVGDHPQLLYKRLKIIKQAQLEQEKVYDEALILGVHLEGTFLSRHKPGIQNVGTFLTPTIENFKKLTGDLEDIVKIVTLAPELDADNKLSEYLESKNIRAHAGHCTAENPGKTTGITHHFNAMEPMTHKKITLAVNALFNDTLFCEIIADGRHVVDDVLRLFFKVKNKDKIILVSDALPIAHSETETIIFCGKTIYQGGKDKDGTLAGACVFLDEIVERIIKEKLYNPKDIEKFTYYNVLEHLKLDSDTVSKLEKLL